MKRVLTIIVFAIIFSFYNNVNAQSYDDWYNFGATIGSAIRQGVDNKREREAEEARQAAERQRQQDEYYRQQAAQQAEYNRQEAARQAEANRQAELARQADAARQAEAERQERARIQEDTRQREAREEAAKREAIQEKNAQMASYNSQNAERRILSLRNPVTFISMEGDDIFLMFTSEKKFAYKNTSDYQQKFTSGNVRIRVKYVGDDEEYSYTDACMINMNKSSEILDLSDVFFDISSRKEIEDIRISFENSKILSTSINTVKAQSSSASTYPVQPSIDTFKPEIKPETKTDTQFPIEIYKIEFANVDFESNVIDDYGKVLYANNVEYLRPKIHYKCTTPNITIKLFYKIIKPDGSLSYSSSNSPVGYTTDTEFTTSNNVSATNNDWSRTLAGWGNKNKTAYTKGGGYRFEVYSDTGVKLFERTFTLY
jgi:hypothetical protein